MTRKHFVELARALHSIRPPARRLGDAEAEVIRRFESWFEAVRVIADTCESANPNFDRGRFIAACEGS